jgi:hypothetical protein
MTYSFDGNMTFSSSKIYALKMLHASILFSINCAKIESNLKKGAFLNVGFG